ncbi:MAG: ribonuclease P protein component [Actinobacteria bacterium]|nr:ribonuclease P protein component [Actinomycetota bacterium]
MKERVIEFDTIKKRKDIDRLRKEGKKYKNRYSILYILPGCVDNPRSRAVFVVSRKIGKSVTRNRTRRVLKEVLRKVLINQRVDIFIIAKNDILCAGFLEIKEELENSLNSFFNR